MNYRSISIRLILSLAALLLGCVRDDNLFHGPYFVRFSGESKTVKESQPDDVLIEVHLASPLIDKDINITYSISGTARENIDYSIVGDRGVITIPANESTAEIDVHLINNSNNILRSQDVVFTLTGVTSEDLKLGQGNSAIGKAFTLTIQDDCILSGVYSAEKDKLSVPTEGVTITSTDCEEYTLSDWDFGVDSLDFRQIRDLTFVDNNDNTLLIPDQEETTLPDNKNMIGGSGIVDPTTGNIIMTVILLDYGGQPKTTFTLKRE